MVSIKHRLQIMDCGLGKKHGLGTKHRLWYKTHTKNYRLGITHSLGYETVHTGCRLHLLSVLCA